MPDELKNTYLSRNPFVKYFFRLKSRIAVNLANLKKNDLILDFGCGAGFLKNKLKKKGYRVIGYDVTKSQTDIEDYRKLSPSKIFAMDVFEHIPKEELKQVIRNFKLMSSKFSLIVAIPTENLISRKIRRILGKKERVEGHVTNIEEILKILNSEFKLEKRINLFFVSYIAKFRN